MHSLLWIIARQVKYIMTVNASMLAVAARLTSRQAVTTLRALRHTIALYGRLFPSANSQRRIPNLCSVVPCTGLRNLSRLRGKMNNETPSRKLHPSLVQKFCGLVFKSLRNDLLKFCLSSAGTLRTSLQEYGN